MEIVTLDKERCMGCGSCVALSSKNFDFDDNGYAEVINTEVTDEARDAEEMCPTSAIKIEKNEL